MTSQVKFQSDEDAWDNGKLGADANFAKPSPTAPESEAAIDAALELQPISIRLQKSLIEDFKLIAELHGLGYQPLMRQVLTRFADSEKKRILRDYAAKVSAQRQEGRADSDELKTGTVG
jgi:hypothetical protein